MRGNQQTLLCSSAIGLLESQIWRDTPSFNFCWFRRYALYIEYFYPRRLVHVFKATNAEVGSSLPVSSGQIRVNSLIGGCLSFSFVRAYPLARLFKITWAVPNRSSSNETLSKTKGDPGPRMSKYSRCSFASAVMEALAKCHFDHASTTLTFQSIDRQGETSCSSFEGNVGSIALTQRS